MTGLVVYVQDETTSFAVGACPACGRTFIFQPEFVPAIVRKANRLAICEPCFSLWNEIHRASKGLEPMALHPLAYAVGDNRPLSDRA